MPYLHFIAIWIAAFILSAQTTTAQLHKSALSNQEFNQLLSEDDPELYELAKGKKLSLNQLETFLATQIYYDAAQDIIDTLGRTYWEELEHKERLHYTNICMLDKYVFIDEEIHETFVFSETFAYVIKHYKEYEKAWGKDLLQSFIHSKLKVAPEMIGLVVSLDEDLSIAKQIAIIDTYAKTIKRVLPQYEDFARYYAYTHLIYDYESEQPKEYYKCLNEYLFRFETDEDKIFNEVMFVIKNHKENYYSKFALNWVEKLLKIRTDAQYKMLKAVLLFRLGEKEEAKITFLRAYMELDETSPFWRRGFPDFYEEIFFDEE